MTDINVVLLENVKNIGLAGEVVKVNDGYARNYLFAKGLAAQATNGRVKELEIIKKKKDVEEKIALEEVQKQVDELDGKTVLMRLKVGSEGQVFGSITGKDLISEIEQSTGIKLPKGVLHLKSPIKQIGETPVHLEFPHGLEADLIVVVEGQQEESK
jgi:large subunit ribosomal protein L9